VDVDDPRERATVGVIIPAYRAATTIGRALASVAAQTVRPTEVIVVDDGSDDGTVEAAKACGALFAGVRFVVLSQENRGAGAARNRAIAECRSTYIAFLDADDEWLPAKLEKSLMRLRDSDLVLVAHNGWIVGDAGERYLDIAARFRACAHDAIHGLYRRGFISTSSVVARREAVVAVGGMDEALRTGQDFDLWLKMLSRPNARYDVFDEPLTRYHIAADGITANTERRLANTLAIALRHAPTVRARTGRCMTSLWFRIVAVHFEAVVSFWRRRRYWAAARTVLGTPITLASMTLYTFKQSRADTR
jgi:glycosyltransferase involved in cell wall biosynthesis